MKFKKESRMCGYFQRVEALLLLKKETSDFYGKGTTFYACYGTFQIHFRSLSA